MDCDEIADEIAELALDAAEGPARGAALAHVAACTNCRRDLADLSAVADDLLLLAPSIEPPEGFEADVLKALGVSRPDTAPVVRRRWPSLAAAAAVSALAGAGVAMVLSSTGGEVDTQVAQFVGQQGNRTGELVLVDGDPGWMLCTFDEPRVDGPYDVEIVLVDGSVIDAGSFTAGEGPDSWGVALEVDADAVDTVRILSPDGELRSTAELDRA